MFINQNLSLLFTQFGLLFREDRFWVVHQRKTYGPFEYQFNQDLRGLVLCYQGEAFGEVCNKEEFFVDLKPFQLPLNVSRVATVVFGWQHECLIHSIAQDDRTERLLSMLSEFGFAHYQPMKIA